MARNRILFVCVAALACGAVQCGSRFAKPPLATVAPATTDFVEVPFPPPPSRVEVVPPKPPGFGLWIDGEWSWTGRRWGWEYGYWSRPLDGETFRPWKTQRLADGTLLFASSTWYDAQGREIPPPVIVDLGGAHQGNVVAPEGESERTAPNQTPSAAPLNLKPAPPP